MTIPQVRVIGIVAIVFVCLKGCDLPRDPEHTLEQVRGGTMRVGIIDDPPWAHVDAEGEPVGVEVRLVERLAQELDADLKWCRGSDSRLMPALEQFELDLVVGGVTDDTPWQTRVGLTNPYLSASASKFGVGPIGEKIRQTDRVFAIPPGENRWLLYVNGFLQKQRAQIPLLVKSFNAQRDEGRP